MVFVAVFYSRFPPSTSSSCRIRSQEYRNVSPATSVSVSPVIVCTIAPQVFRCPRRRQCCLSRSSLLVHHSLTLLQPVQINLQIHLATVQAVRRLQWASLTCRPTKFYSHCSFPSRLLSHRLVSNFARFIPTSFFPTPRTPFAPWAFILFSMLCSTTPTPSFVGPVLWSSTSGPAIASSSLFLKKWHYLQIRDF